ncbi:MAG: beta-propeller fold lactonase family protein, partial [Aureliella sp.]
MLRRCCLLTIVLLSLFSLWGHTSAQAQDRFRVYLGTYTDDGSQGIYQCEFNAKDGSISPVTLAAKTNSPSFLAFHPNGKFMVAVNERDAMVSAFAIDAETGILTFINSQPTQGDAPCHLVVDSAGKNVLVANYTGGSCISIPLEVDGSLGSTSSFQQHRGPKKNGHS